MSPGTGRSSTGKRGYFLVMRCRALLPVTMLLLMAAPAAAQQPNRLTLTPCTLPGVAVEGRCGVDSVAEHPRASGGRKLPLFVAVLPAREAPVEPDPLFVLAGGPGQAATSLAGFATTAFATVWQHRDLVLVDLAGTGRSAALDCQLYQSPRDLAGDFYPAARVTACRDSLAKVADLKRYTTAVLVDDLDAVRAALGYPRINLYGTSYGSRAALSYLRRHGDHVRSVVLKAVAPPTMRGTMDYARDTEHALQTLFAACAADARCAGAFPRPGAELAEVLTRADRGRLRGRVPDPAGGPAVELPLNRGLVASTLLGLLQNSNAAVRLPWLVHTVYQGDTGPLVDEIVQYRRGLDAGISFGMHLSVECSESAPRLNLAASARNDRGTALGDYRVAQLAKACHHWVRGPVPANHAEPVRSDVPVLLVSGGLDPNTPPHWGAEAARTLSHATHIVIPTVAHGFSSVRECGAAFVSAFIAAASADGIDFSCSTTYPLPPFALSLP